MSKLNIFRRNRPRSEEETRRPVLKWYQKFGRYVTRRAENSDQTKQKAVSRVNCVACGDPIIKAFATLAPCGHYYDSMCLELLFSLSLKDASMMPPRCCRVPIPLEDAAWCCSEQIRKEFRNKIRELADPDPLYCSESICGQWIPSEKINLETKTGMCWAGHETCTTCKHAAHKQGTGAKECIQSLVEDRALAFVVAQGWKRCGRCKIFVERTAGCLHMTCRCGYHFCYACTRPWENCKSTCLR